MARANAQPDIARVAGSCRGEEPPGIVAEFAHATDEVDARIERAVETAADGLRAASRARASAPGPAYEISPSASQPLSWQTSP
jgi:hypothetical protein